MRLRLTSRAKDHQGVRVVRREYRAYSLLTRSMLGLARRPWLRRRLLQVLARVPRLFELALHAALGTASAPHVLRSR